MTESRTEYRYTIQIHKLHPSSSSTITSAHDALTTHPNSVLSETYATMHMKATTNIGNAYLYSSKKVIPSNAAYFAAGSLR
eukprot:m.643873 g.643873  ORF g.643873 m.643873 type:complete len:81 (+) comp22643_c2_seq1:425-667(+)